MLVPPHTWLPNEVLTAALLNTHLRDAMLETPAAKATAAGQLFQAIGVGEIAPITPVAYRMPRTNPAANAIEYYPGLNLTQAPIYARSGAPVNMGNGLANIATIVSQAVTCLGSQVVVKWYCQTTEAKSAASQAFHGAGLYADGVLVGDLHIPANYVGAAGTFSADISGVHSFNAPLGTVTFTVKAYYVNNLTTGTPTANAQLVVEEFAP